MDELSADGAPRRVEEDAGMKPIGTSMITLAMAAVLTACATTQAPPAPRPPAPRPPARVMTPPVESAVEMCHVDSLTAQYETLSSGAGSLRTGDGGLSTEALEMVSAFEVDLDASYRFATSSCRILNRCLEAHDFNEAECGDSLISWRQSQRGFHELSVRLAEIRERIARSCGSCSSRPMRQSSTAQPERDDSFASVFSTGGR